MSDRRHLEEKLANVHAHHERECLKLAQENQKLWAFVKQVIDAKENYHGQWYADDILKYLKEDAAELIRDRNVQNE